MESNRDSPSSGERTGNSLNRTGVIARERYPSGVVGASVHHHGGAEELQSRTLVELSMERQPQRVTAP